MFIADMCSKKMKLDDGCGDGGMHALQRTSVGGRADDSQTLPPLILYFGLDPAIHCLIDSSIKWCRRSPLPKPAFVQFAVAHAFAHCHCCHDHHPVENFEQLH